MPGLPWRWDVVVTTGPRGSTRGPSVPRGRGWLRGLLGGDGEPWPPARGGRQCLSGTGASFALGDKILKKYMYIFRIK